MTLAEAQASSLYCPTCERTFAVGLLCPEDNTKLIKLEVDDPMLERILDGRYTLTAKLGSGGMGSVYRASQHSMGRDVAIKLMAPNLISDKDAIKRFLREAKLASSFAHPNAVGVLDFGQTDDGLFFLVMELVDGTSLAELLATEPVMPLARVIRIATQICDALESAHDHHIVHRDLKPANVMVLAGGRDLVKVLDFGIAKSLHANETNMTHTGVVIGTPSYMSPEVATGREIDVRADLYSLGCMLYQMMTGKLPFVAASTHEVMLMQHDQPPAPMFGVPDACAAVVMRLLEKSRDKRFPSAAATRDALEAAASGVRDSRPVIAAPSSATAIHGAITPLAPEPIVVRRKPSAVIAIFAVVALASGAAAFAVIKSMTGATPVRGDAPAAIAHVVTSDAAITDAAPSDAAPSDAASRATTIDAGAISRPHHHRSTGSAATTGSGEDDPPF